MTENATVSESAERLRAILDAAVDAIITIEESGVVESVNPAAERMFGYARDELVGSNVSVLMPSPYREEHDRYIANYLRTGEARIIGVGREIEAQRKDGSVFPADIAVSEVRLSDRRLFTGIIRDLTERREMEERARLRLEDAAHTARLLELGEMCSGIVHEVNQPLTAITTFAEACLRRIRTGGAEPGLVEDTLGRVREQGVLAAEIVSRLRGLVHKGESRRETFDLGPVIEETLLIVNHERRRRGVRVSVFCEPELPPVRGDRVQIEQILLNLIGNAFHAMEDADPRQVWLRTGRAGADRVRMVVEDSGRGLAPELRERVFETSTPRNRAASASGSRSVDPLPRVTAGACGQNLPMAAVPDSDSIFLAPRGICRPKVVRRCRNRSPAVICDCAVNRYIDLSTASLTTILFRSTTILFGGTTIGF